MTVPSSLSNLNLTTFNKLYPLLIQKYNTLIPDPNANILDKINSIVDYLNSVGNLSNEVVDNWNKVMAWVMSDGLTTDVNNKIEAMNTNGEFNSVLNSLFNAEIGDLSTLTTTDKSKIVNAINEVEGNTKTNAAQLADMAQAVYAKKYVVGDGTTDDTTSLRNTIAAVPKDGTLIINCPIYVTDTITFNQQMNIICVNGGVIIPSGHSNTAVVIGDINGISRYADMDIDIKILGGASSRNYGLILQNLSDCRIKATVMCGSVYGVGGQGLLVNDIKLIVSANYPSSYVQSFVMPTTANIHLLYSNVSGGYVGGNNANNLNVISEGGSTGLLIDDQHSQGNNYIKGTIQGGSKGFDITNCMSMTIKDIHVEANTNPSTITNCIASKIAGAFNNDSLTLAGSHGTSIENISCKNLTIDSASSATVIQTLTINGGSYTDNAPDTQTIGTIYGTNTVTTFLKSAFMYNLNGVNQANVASGTATILNVSTTEFDVKSEYVSAAHCFKPKTKGKYRLDAAVNFTTAVPPQNVQILIYKNGVLYKSCVGNSISCVVDCVSPNNDFFQVYVLQTSGAAVTIDGTNANTYFCGNAI